MMVSVESLLDSVLSHYRSGEVSKQFGDDFKELPSAKKNHLLSMLVKNGVPQKDIAQLFSITPSAVSQRLNPSPRVAFLAQVKRLEHLRNSGFSTQSIASLLKDNGMDISPEEIEAFFKIKSSFETL